MILGVQGFTLTTTTPPLDQNPLKATANANAKQAYAP